MSIKRKFCGMTRKEDIAFVDSLGVEFVGFVFHPPSPRSVDLATARQLVPSAGSAKTVGVFVEQSVEEINQIADELNLDFIQLHGEPSINQVQQCNRPVIQAFRGVPDLHILEEYLSVCEYVLIDKPDGSDVLNFTELQDLPEAICQRLFIAGGISKEVLPQVLESVQPFAIDVARGIEQSPGVKDHALMQSLSHMLS